MFKILKQGISTINFLIVSSGFQVYDWSTSNADNHGCGEMAQILTLLPSSKAPFALTEAVHLSQAVHTHKNSLD